MTQDFVFGAYYAQFAKRDSNGYPKGVVADPDNVANDTTMHAYLRKDITDFTPPAPTRDLVTDRGGMKIRAQADLGVSDLGTATMTFSEFDDVFHSYITDSAIDAASPSGFRQVGSNVNVVDLPSWFVVISVQAISINPSTGAQTRKWRHWIMPNAQIRPVVPNASQNAGVNPNPLQYEIVPSTSNRTLTGELFSATTMAVVDDADFLYSIQTSNPIAITSYTANAANPETFTTAYKPLTSEATTTDKILTQNGVSDTITSLSTTTGVLQTATGTAGDIYVLVFETAFVPV